LGYHSKYQTQEGIRYVFRCRSCRKTFCDRFGTAFYDLKMSEEKVTRCLQQVAEGLSFEAIARIEQVHPTTVQRWLERASLQAELLDQELVSNVKAKVIEMDEVYSFAGNKQSVPETAEEETGKHWTHCAMERENRLLLAVAVGPRTEETATVLVKDAASRLSEHCYPLWSSDGWKAYLEALLSVFAIWLYSIRPRRQRGRPRDPQRVPHPNLRYGQVVKQYVGSRVVGITKRVVFGVEEMIALDQISTSLLERLNGTLRLHVSPLHRKTRTFAKERESLGQHLCLFKSYYNFCLSHSSLNYLTPAQAAGLTEKKFTMKDLLSYGSFNFSKIS
jgi:transposase-like protein/IS1 family transposase